MKAYAANSDYSSAPAVGSEMALQTGTNFISGSAINNTIKNDPNITGSLLTTTKTVLGSVVQSFDKAFSFISDKFKKDEKRF